MQAECALVLTPDEATSRISRLEAQYTTYAECEASISKQVEVAREFLIALQSGLKQAQVGVVKKAGHGEELA